MERKTRRLVTGLAATGVLAGALAGGGVVLADSAGAAPANVADVAAASSGTTAAGTAASAAAALDGGAARYLRVRGAGLVFRASAAYLGLSRKQLAAELKAGKSLDAVAAQRGKSASGLDSAIVAATTKRIDASKLSAARKTALTGFVKNHVAAFTAAPHPFRWAVRQLAAAAVAGGSGSGSSPAGASTS